MDLSPPTIAGYAVFSNLIYSVLSLVSGLTDFAQAGFKAVILGFLKINSGLIFIISAFLLLNTDDIDLMHPSALWLSVMASLVMIIVSQVSPPVGRRLRLNRVRIPDELLVLSGVVNLCLAFFLLSF